MHQVRIFVILHLRAYFLSLTVFCMLKIAQTVEEVSFLKQTVSTFSLLVFFGFILPYNNIKVAIDVLWSKIFLVRASESPYKSLYFSHLCEDHISK